MAGGVEGARGWYVWRCLRMELSRRRLSWSWSLFTWRRELRIPSLGARADAGDGYATAPSEGTTKAADSLLAKQRLVVWSRTTSPPATLPSKVFSLPSSHSTCQSHPLPFSRDPSTSLPKSRKRRASPSYTAAGKRKHGILEKTDAVRRF